MSKMSRARKYIGKTINVIEHSSFISPFKVHDVVYVAPTDERCTILHARPGLNFMYHYPVIKERLEINLKNDLEKLERWETKGFTQEECARLVNLTLVSEKRTLQHFIDDLKKTIETTKIRLQHPESEYFFFKLYNRLDRDIEIVED